MNGDALDWGIIGLPWLAGLLVLASHVPLGARVLQRGIVFIDLAIAQIAALGALAASVFGLPADGAGARLCAFAAAAAGALAFRRLERTAGRHQEALIGTGFVLAASAGILVLARSPHAGEHLQDLLVGQILWTGWREAGELALMTAGLGAVRATGLGRRLGRSGFYLAFALAVTASVQLVGVYLVFASLIIPALATGAGTGRARSVAAFVVGTAGYGLGLALSALLDLPSGAAIVWALAGCGALAWTVLPPPARSVGEKNISRAHIG